MFILKLHFLKINFLLNIIKMNQYFIKYRKFKI